MEMFDICIRCNHKPSCRFNPWPVHAGSRRPRKLKRAETQPRAELTPPPIEAMSAPLTSAPKRVDLPRADAPVLDKVEDAISAIKTGQFVVVVDDMDRENEGDLVMAASTISTEQMAWLIRHSS